MADDPSRRDKVAAGLKKLKQFQQRSGKKVPKSLNDQIASNNRHSSPDLSRLSGSTQHQVQTVLNESSSINDISKLASPSHHTSHSGQEVSATESLHQLRQQLNGLMNETHDVLNGSSENGEPTEQENYRLLERRNLELAAQLSQQTQGNQQLQFQIQELKGRLSRQQKESEREKEELRERAHKDQVVVKDQLQVHIQTIGILVAEKTELQSTLAQSQQSAKQRAAEAEEYQGRLRASRQRLSDIEKELSTANSSGQQLDKTSKDLNKEVDRLKLENYKSGKQNEELSLQTLELSEKLKSKSGECDQLVKQLSDLRSKLSETELYVLQLTNNHHNQNGTSSDLPSTSQQLEDLHQEKLDLQRKITKYKDTFERMSSEKEQLSSHYQSYAKQLNSQLDSARDELRQITEDLSRLRTEKTELETRLASTVQSQGNREVEEASAKALKEQLDSIIREKDQLQEQLKSQLSDNEHISLLLEERESRLCVLESSLSQFREQELDKEGLLETMQSDKVAASRAVTQNNQLKQQLQELQDGFIKVNDDRLQLTEKLQNEHHVSKELSERLCQQEEELSDLRVQLGTRDNQLKKLEETSSRSQLQQHQIVDRMRHYEAQGQLTEMLQAELAQAQERNNAMAAQNSQLRMALARQAENVSDKLGPDNSEQSKRNDLVASLSASVRQLELERDQLMSQLENQKSHRDTLQSQMSQIQANSAERTSDESDAVSVEEYKKVKDGMNMLEERFRKTMEQIADMEEQKQQLEHLVMQLQGETDTIADYITLYQIQRGAMRQRAEEKDMYIAQLSRDREDLKSKLSELQDLVMRLLGEKKQLQAHNAANEALRKAPGRPKLTGSDRNNPFDGPLITAHALAPEKVLEDITSDRGLKKENTAKKIMDLLADIGTSNLIEKNPMPDTFHPCPVCSGRLMTV